MCDSSFFLLCSLLLFIVVHYARDCSCTWDLALLFMADVFLKPQSLGLTLGYLNRCDQSSFHIHGTDESQPAWPPFARPALAHLI